MSNRVNEWTGAMRAVLAALVALVPALVVAQPNPQLPSLTPRVFESRGTIEVSLPDIERQPLSGFGPPPRTFVVPADRQSIAIAFTPDLSALPSLVLEAPQDPVIEVRPRRRFRAEGGAGAYVSRYGRLDLSGAGAAGEFFVDADYDGIGQTDDRVSFDRIRARAGGRSFAPGRLRIEGDAVLDGYSTPATFNREDRVRRAVGLEVGLEGVGAAPFALTARYEQGALGREDDSEPESAEGRVDAQGRLAFARDLIRLDAAGGIAGTGAVGTDVRYGAGGLAVAFGRAEGARVALGARALVLDVDGPSTGADTQTAGPVVDVSIPFGTTARLFARNDPHVAVRSLTDLTGVNPFVVSDPLVVPDVYPIDARAGLELRPGAARVRVFGIGQRAPTYLIFEQAGGEFTTGVLDLTVLGLGGDMSLIAPGGISFAAGLEVRAASAEGVDAVPFYAPVQGRAGLQVPFAAGRGRIGLAATAESGRPLDRTGGDDADPWGLFALDARFDVTPTLSAMLRGERLLGDAERWPGSPEPPFTVLAGIRLSR